MLVPIQRASSFKINSIPVFLQLPFYKSRTSIHIRMYYFNSFILIAAKHSLLKLYLHLYNHSLILDIQSNSGLWNDKQG